MEAIVFCGIQGSGKTTFFRERFFDTHVRINLDMLRTRHREAALLEACLSALQPFVVDNTNPTVLERARYVAPARAAGFRVIGYFFSVDTAEAMARNSTRASRGRVAASGVIDTLKRQTVPRPSEGFDELFVVGPDGRGGFVVNDMPDQLQLPLADGSS